MHTSTKLTRWLLTAVVMLVVTGTASAQRTVTLQLNTATAPDTLDAMDVIQIRGQLGSGTALPGGGVIDWNDATTLRPVNVGGDYWELAFQIPDNDPLKFKFYSQAMEDAQIGGWEDGGDHEVAAGTGDITLPIHYFEKGPDKPYDWSPFHTGADSVGVLLRVFANTTDGLSAGYKGENSDQLVVAGDPMGGASQMDWNGGSGVKLRRESTTKGQPGYHIFSGVAYYPLSAAGQTQKYKFFVQPSGWESSPDREFVVPDKDTTIRWVYYGNSKPLTAQPVEAPVIFSVDVTPLEDIGIFRRTRGDTLQVRGSFNGWGCSNPDRCLMDRIPGTNSFEAFVPLTLLPETNLEYKYRIQFNIPEMQAEWGVDVIPSGWEEPYISAGANRVVQFQGDPDQDQYVEQVFNDIFPRNVMLGGDRTDVTFSVDMTPALSAAEPFDPANHTVTLAFGDPIFSMTQGFPLTPRDDNPNEGDALNLDQFSQMFSLTDPDGDMVYTGTLRVVGPTYAALQYQIAYGSSGAWQQEAGGGTSGGRRRQRFVPQNPDGSWPDTYQVPTESYQAEGDLPGSPNPAVVTSVEPVNSEVPQQVNLSQNFPNPFNPTTSFEYSITNTADVKVQVFDVLGRVVATLVDGVQQPANYRVSFDASQLASGTYIYRLQTPTQTLTRTMVLLK